MATNDEARLTEYVVVMAAKDQRSLGALRTMKSLLVAESEALIWIKGIPFPGDLPLSIRQLPTLETYLLNSAGLLFPIGKITPIGKLKSMDWQPVSDFIKIEFPVAAFPGKVNDKISIELIPASQQEEGNALLTDLHTWKEYVTQAPGIRLEKLRYAVSEDGDVLILGTPLSPIPGREYRLRSTLLLPCGVDFRYAFLSGIIEEELNPLKESLLLFYPTGKWTKIPLHNFQPVTRSGVRLTQ